MVNAAFSTWAVTCASRSPSGLVSAAVKAAVTSAGSNRTPGLAGITFGRPFDQRDSRVDRRAAVAGDLLRRPAASSFFWSTCGSSVPLLGRSDSAATKSRGCSRTLLLPKTRVTGPETAGLAKPSTAALTSASSISGCAETRSTTAVGSSARYAAVIASRACSGSMDRPGRGLTTVTRVPWNVTLPSRAGRPLALGEPGEVVGHRHLGRP